MTVNTKRFSPEQYEYKTGHKGLFFLRVHHPDRHGLTLLQGGQSPKQYAPRVPNQSTNQSNTTPQTAA